MRASTVLLFSFVVLRSIEPDVKYSELLGDAYRALIPEPHFANFVGGTGLAERSQKRISNSSSSSPVILQFSVHSP